MGATTRTQRVTLVVENRQPTWSGRDAYGQSNRSTRRLPSVRSQTDPPLSVRSTASVIEDERTQQGFDRCSKLRHSARATLRLLLHLYSVRYRLSIALRYLCRVKCLLEWQEKLFCVLTSTTTPPSLLSVLYHPCVLGAIAPAALCRGFLHCES